MTATVRLALTPRDGLFCKDGRGWHTSASGRGHGLDWPWPSTLLGALRSAWGRAEEGRTGQRFGPEDWRGRTSAIGLGPTLVLRRDRDAPWQVAHRVWPAPSDAVSLEECAQVQRLDPAPRELPADLPTLGRDDDDAREALWVARLDDAAKPLPGARWWSEGRFATWLAGGSVPARDPAQAFDLSRRVQAHVGIRAGEQTADDGVLFSHDVVETFDLCAEWAIGLEAVLPDADGLAVATLGSDGRLVRVETLPDPLFDPPAALLEAFRGGPAGLRLLVVTPACFEGGWLPDGLARYGREIRGRVGALGAEVVLRAALVPRPVHVSGWDMAGRVPKATSRMVPPGAVYFFERADGRPFAEADARACWLAAWGARTGEGFGRVVPGVWNPARGER